MSARVRTKVDKVSGDRVAYSDMAIRNNSAIIEYCRTSMAALSGATSGKFAYCFYYYIIGYSYLLCLLFMSVYTHTHLPISFVLVVKK